MGTTDEQQEGGAGRLPGQRQGGRTDQSSVSGAQEIVRQLDQYWIDHGFYSQRFEVFMLERRDSNLPVFGIKSNLINGLPPKGPVG